MKYRIKHIDMIGYFAQVKKSRFSGWKTIGKHSIHSICVGEYEEDHLDHPLAAQADAVLLCHRHADFVGAKKGFTSYRDVMF